MKGIASSGRIGALAVVAVALLATVVPSAALAYTSTGTSYPLIVVDNGAGVQHDPRVAGNYAVYTDDQGGLSSRIEYVDLSTNATNLIAKPPNTIDFLPDVSPDAIAFTRLSSAGSAIYLYYLGAGFSIEVAPTTMPNRRNPAIGGPTIVWEDVGVSATADPELVVATSVFGTTPPLQLTNDAPADRNPNVSPNGATIVWEKCSAACDVYAATGVGASWMTTTPVATSTSDEIWPDTNGSEIVYASNAGGNYHVYVTMLGGTPVQLSVPGSVSENHPTISGSFVAFEASNGAQTDIWVYDLTTGTARRITNTPESEVLSDITSGASAGTTTVTVVWQVSEAGTGTDFNVYASQFQGPSRPASLTLSPAADTNPVGTSHTVTATVLDGAGQAVPNVVVRFSVSGSVTASGQCTSGANGECNFSYQGPQLPGADLISAFADTDGDGVWDQCLIAVGCFGGEPDATATKAWVLPTSTAGQSNGGGQIQNAAGDKISFGFFGKSAGGLQGTCNVVEQGGRMIKCLDVTALVLSGNQATIYGNATDNGAATTYVIHAADNADPGKGGDTFSIQSASGYSASGTLTAGNVQVQP
jgi:Bacterial Ig-like domain (group 1)